MSTRGPILIKDLKRKSKSKQRRGKPKEVDAKKAYAFVNEKAKQRANSIETVALVSRRFAEVSAKCETLILGSRPVRLAVQLFGKIWPVRAAKNLVNRLSH